LAAAVEVLRPAQAAVRPAVAEVGARPAAAEVDVEVLRPAVADAEASRSARHRVAVCVP
jgi:hypothetical protein